MLKKTDAFVELIETTPVTIEEWQRQREIQLKQDRRKVLQLGFSTFFLNRTNRSGIIKGAGVIGGLDQSGKYPIDCRFNKEGLTKRIRRIKKYEDRIHLTKLDAIEFLEKCQSELPTNSFLCIDPPYFNKGKSLYTSAYCANDHEEVARAILKSKLPYIVTYDDTPEIRKHYLQRRQYRFDINYSVQTKRIGTELLIASKGLRLPSEVRHQQVNKPNSKAA